MIKLWPALLWFSLLLLTPLLAPPALGAAAAQAPKIGLALSGGGARGVAHVGVLKVLEELNITVDYIAGTSMGAIIGGLYAAGFTPEEIEQLLVETDWNSAFKDNPPRRDDSMRKKGIESRFVIPHKIGLNDGEFQLPLGLIQGQHLDQIFQRLLLPVSAIDDFDDLGIPFRAVATDLVTGEEVVLSSGSLPDALRASMSIPGVFAPVRLGERFLVDGGMANNLPVSVAREMGADIVIAVDISSPLLKEEELVSVLRVTEQLTNFLTRKNTEQQLASLGADDVLLVPDLTGVSSAEFSGFDKIIELGYLEASGKRERLAVLSGNTTPVRPDRPQFEERDYLVHFVEVDNGSLLEDSIIYSRIELHVGEPLDMSKLEQSLDQVYALDLFQTVTYDLVTNDAGDTGVRISALPRSWGPNYMQFLLEFSDDFSGNNDFKLGAAYTRHAINKLGGELRFEGAFGREGQLSIDFYQPIDSRAQWFVEPQVFYNRQNYNVFLEGILDSVLEIKGFGTRLGVGRNFNARNLVRLDYELFRGAADIIAGDLPFPLDDNVDIGDLTLTYAHDSLNNFTFPTKGQRHQLSYLYADRAIGAAFSYSQVSATGNFAFSRGKNSAQIYYEVGYSVDDKAPVERWFRLGGLGRLSGLIPNQLSGRHLGLLSFAYYRRLNEIDFFPAYAGISLEAGNTWQFEDDISFDSLRASGSLFLGADSPIGPVYLAWGHSDNGDDTFYFYLGNPFNIRRF